MTLHAICIIGNLFTVCLLNLAIHNAVLDMYLFKSVRHALQSTTLQDIDRESGSLNASRSMLMHMNRPVHATCVLNGVACCRSPMHC